MSGVELLALADRVDALDGADNVVDVLVEIALFRPCADFASVRANAAGTKCIFTRHDGTEVTHWAEDWTMDACVPSTVDALRARAALSQHSGERS